MTAVGPYLAGRGCSIDLRLPAIMGILNVTPDSFSDGGDFSTREAVLTQALEMQEAGAAIIDIGGESTRPGAPAVSVAEEIDRVVPAIEWIRRETDLPISIDTTKSEVALAAMAAGANFINDISGLTFDSAMASAAVQSDAGLFLMHTRGRPQDMQTDTRYSDLVGEVVNFLTGSASLAEQAGVQRSKIALDPGIGFAKDVEGNLTLLDSMKRFVELGYPVLLGTSRKSFIGKITAQTDPKGRLAGTLATVALGVASGVQLFRVHDVGPARDAALVAWGIRERQVPC